MTLYTFQVAETLINRYNDFPDSVVLQTDEGVLGIGDWICAAPGKKTTIIKEVYISPWSSGQSIRKYNRTPAKYQKILDNQ